MAEITFEHPLKYQEGWVRTVASAVSYGSSFPQNLTIASTLTYLKDELSDIGATSICVYSNYNNLGNDRARSKARGSDGVRVKFTAHGTEYNIACDKWQNIEHNLYVLHLSIRHFKQIESWGVLDMPTLLSVFTDNPAAFTKEMPQSTPSRSTVGANAWATILGLGESATLSDANAIYRSRAKAIANDPDKMLELNAAIEQARKFLK